MRSIKYFNQDMTIDDFVRKEICKNDGTDSPVFKADLLKNCTEKGLKVSSRMTKRQLLDQLLSCCTYEELARKYGIGVSSQQYQKAFNISHQDVKLLEKSGVLKIVGSYSFRAFGKKMQAPTYDIYQFANMKEEELQAHLTKKEH